VKPFQGGQHDQHAVSPIRAMRTREHTARGGAAARPKDAGNRKPGSARRAGPALPGHLGHRGRPSGTPIIPEHLRRDRIRPDHRRGRPGCTGTRAPPITGFRLPRPYLVKTPRLRGCAGLFRLAGQPAGVGRTGADGWVAGIARGGRRAVRAPRRDETPTCRAARTRAYPVADHRRVPRVCAVAALLAAARWLPWWGWLGRRGGRGRDPWCGHGRPGTGQPIIRGRDRADRPTRPAHPRGDHPRP